MKITAIELFHISLPFAKPYSLSKVYGTLVNAEAVIVKVHTDTGIAGFGEADPMNPFTEETPGTVMAVIRDQMALQLIGSDPTAVAMIDARLDRTLHGNLMARGAINMALFDILGKVYKLPAHTFLGGMIHRQLPVLWPIGSGTPEEDAVAIESAIQAGFRTVMIKMGALPVKEEIARMVAASERFGSRMAIIADANQGWGYKEALVFLDGIRGHEPDIIEQPLPYHETQRLKNLCERTSCLLSADESVMTRQDAAALLRNDTANVFSIKVSKNGGLRRSKELADLAAAFGVRCLMNSMLEFGITQAASLQVGCTLNNLVDCGHAYMSVLRMSDDITDFGKNVSAAVVTVPEAPGLGVTVDEAKLNKYAVGHLSVKG